MRALFLDCASAVCAYVREAQAFQPPLEACWLVLTAAVVCFSGKSILALFRC
jgi:hypothetical protein